MRVTADLKELVADWQIRNGTNGLPPALGLPRVPALSRTS